MKTARIVDNSPTALMPADRSAAGARLIEALRVSPLKVAILTDCLMRTYAAGNHSAADREEIYALARALEIDAAQVHALEERALERAAAAPRPGLSASALGRITHYIDTHLEQKLSVAELAGVAGVSSSHFKTLFRRSTLVSVHRYVMQRRVDRAWALIQDNAPIAPVAAETGFTDASHLARWMRRLLGVTPSSISKRRR